MAKYRIEIKSVIDCECAVDGQTLKTDLVDTIKEAIVSEFEGAHDATLIGVVQTADIRPLEASNK